MRASLLLTVFIAGTLSVQAQPQKAVADKVIAVVGDRIILYSELKNAIDDADRQGNTLTEEAACKLVEEMVISKMLTVQAEKDSLPVTDEEVEGQLEQMIRSFTRSSDYWLTPEKVQELKENIRTPLKERMLATAMQDKVLANITITPSEVESYYNRIPADSLPFFESELEIGQIIIYPKATHELEKYVLDELISYKRQIEAKTVTFEQMAQRNSQDRNYEYTIRRTDKEWDASFIAMVFLLKEGQISGPTRNHNGFYLIKMIERRGIEADVQLILKVPPVTTTDINQVMAKLDTARAKIIGGQISFNEALVLYSNDEEKYYSPFISGATIDQLDKEMVVLISKMKPGEYSQPVSFVNASGKKGAKLVYFKSRTEPHRMNMKDDYIKISRLALDEKRTAVLQKWYRSKASSFYIAVDNDTIAQCAEVKKYVTGEIAPQHHRL